MEALGGREEKGLGKQLPLLLNQCRQQGSQTHELSGAREGEAMEMLNVASVSRPGTDEQKSLWLATKGASSAVHSQEAEGLGSMCQGVFQALEEDDKIPVDPLCQHEVWEA